MNKLWILALALLSGACAQSGNQGSGTDTGSPAESPEAIIPADSARTDTTGFSNLTEKASYIYGLEMGEHYRNQFMDVDPDAFRQGLIDALENRRARIAGQEREEVLVESRKKQIEDMEQRNAILSERNIKAARAFLAENTKREGVITLASGVQYMVLRAGSGPSPNDSDLVRVHYTGSLLSGRVFDSSHEAGAPQIFMLKTVMEGWREGMKRAQTGGKYRFWIPPELAYGEQGSLRIEPNSLLVFEVELLEINPKL